MTTYPIGDLLLVNFPFTVSGAGKPRPALVILDTGDAADRKSVASVLQQIAAAW
jgi:chloramphenicol 3-O-phosphotransferase